MPRPVRRGRALAVLIVCLFLVQLDTMLLSVAAGVLFQPAPVGLGLTQGEFLWVGSAYTLVFTGVLLLAGWLGDRAGRRSVLGAGMIVFALASAACSLATQPWHLIAGRAVLGLGAALVSPNTLGTLVSLYTGREERARAIGLWSTAVGIALAAGPIVAGLLLQHYRWPALFWVNVPVSLVALLGLVAWVPNTRGHADARVDVAGIVTSLAGLALVIQGVLWGGDSGDWLGWRAAGSIALGIVVLAAFVRIELVAPSPMLDVRWFRIPAVWRSVALSAVSFMAMSGAMFVVGLWMLVYRGYSPIRTGLLLLPLAIGQFLLAPVGQSLVKRYGPRAIATFGALLMTAGLAAFVVVPRYGVAAIEAGMFAVGAALSLILPTATVEIQSSIPAAHAGAASGINNLFRQVGATLGGAILGSVLAARYRAGIGSDADPLPPAARDAVLQSLQACYIALQHVPDSPAAQALARTLRATAEDSFRSAFVTASLVSAALALLAVVAAAGLARRLPEHGPEVPQSPAPEETARPQAQPEPVA